MSRIIEAFDLLDEIEATNSRNEKKDILAKGEENEVFKDLLKKAYDPFLKFNLVKFNEGAPKEDSGAESYFRNYERFLEILQSLTSSEISGNNAIEIVESFFYTLDNRERKWYARVLKKDLRAGITDSTINSVFKKLIPKFDCMLAKPWEDVKKKPKRVIVDKKLDGYRAVSFVNAPDSVEIFTRNGKSITGFKAVEEDLKLLPSGYVYDAEIVGKDNEFSDMQKLVFNKKVEEKAGTLVIFDVLPIDEFREGKSSATLVNRKANLSTLAEEFPNLENIRFEVGHPTVLDPVNDWEEIENVYLSFVKQGYEGAMIKNADSYYVCKRSADWAKIKPFETGDFEITGFYEGEGKFEGMLGGFVIDFEGYEVEVGSGYSDSQRQEYWENRNELISSVIEVQYQDVTENEKGTKSLRFPTFVSMRFDK